MPNISVLVFDVINKNNLRNDDVYRINDLIFFTGNIKHAYTQ